MFLKSKYLNNNYSKKNNMKGYFTINGITVREILDCLPEWYIKNAEKNYELRKNKKYSQ